MPIIRLETHIKAKQKIVFDLSRSIDFQSEAVRSSNERTVAGRTSGLIGLNETITWHGKNPGVWQHLTTRVTDLDPPHFFADEMEKGAFKSIRHEHYFSKTEEEFMLTINFG